MVLITGGAGYIGSHVAKQLLEQGEGILVLDNLSTGFLKTIETLQKIRQFDLKEFENISKP